MTDRQPEEAKKPTAEEQDYNDIELTELEDEDLEGASGGVYIPQNYVC